MKRKNIQDEIDKVRNIVLDSAREITEITLPMIAETFTKIVSGFIQSVGNTIKTELHKKLEEKKIKTVQEKTDDDF